MCPDTLNMTTINENKLCLTCDNDVRCAIATSATYHRYVASKNFPESIF